MYNNNDMLWVERYRPKTISDCILSKELKKTFTNFVKQKSIPNLILSGSSGIGKTTVARAMLEECGFDYIVMNGSNEGRLIETFRRDILTFASTVSLYDVRKYIILDEADYLNKDSVQPALRNFMEEYSSNCGFIFTCNFKNRIIDAVLSRCSVIEFNIENSEKPALANSFMKSIEKILSDNKIEYDKKVIEMIIVKHFPDWRRVINELQRYSISGKIDSSILVNIANDKFDKLMEYLKNKDFAKMRTWVAAYNDTGCSYSQLFRMLYDNVVDHVETESIPVFIVDIADYSYKAAFVADQEVNLAACLIEIMNDCKFKI